MKKRQRVLTIVCIIILIIALGMFIIGSKYKTCKVIKEDLQNNIKKTDEKNQNKEGLTSNNVKNIRDNQEFIEDKNEKINALKEDIRVYKNSIEELNNLNKEIGYELDKNIEELNKKIQEIETIQDEVENQAKQKQVIESIENLKLELSEEIKNEINKNFNEQPKDIKNLGELNNLNGFELNPWLLILNTFVISLMFFYLNFKNKEKSVYIDFGRKNKSY